MVPAPIFKLTLDGPKLSASKVGKTAISKLRINIK